MYSNGSPWFLHNSQMPPIPSQYLLTNVNNINQQQQNLVNNQMFINQQIPPPQQQMFIQSHTPRPLIQPYLPPTPPVFQSLMQQNIPRPLIQKQQQLVQTVNNVQNQDNTNKNFNKRQNNEENSQSPTKKRHMDQANNNNNNKSSNTQANNTTKIFRFNKVNMDAKSKPNESNVNVNVAANSYSQSNNNQANGHKNNSSNNKSHINTNASINEVKTNELPSLLSLKIPPPLPPPSKPPPPPPLTTPLLLQKNNLFPILNDNNNLNKHVDVLPLIEPKHKVISIEDLLKKPDRCSRSSKIAIILRGLPGSGKSYLANLIKHEEEKISSSKPKILSIDNYFMCEQEKEIKNGLKTSKEITLEYEYDESMNDAYQRSLVKSFKKTVEDGLFDFIIVDMINEQLVHIEDMHNFAKSKGFQVFIIEIIADIESCKNKNIHNRTLNEIKDISKKWEPLPYFYIKLDCRSLLQDDAIENVEMDDACDTTDNNISNKTEESKLRENSEESNENESVNTCNLLKSKWDAHDMSDDRLNRLDGITSSKRCKTNTDEANLSLDSYLELNDHKEQGNLSGIGKCVKWRDVEEENRFKKQKELGFIVGQTSHEDWKKMTDENFKKSQNSLTSYKYI